jgi:hypothetical protein
MNYQRKSLQLRIQNPAYRLACERLDAALEKNTPSNNYKIIQLMRREFFKDVEERAATLKLPERKKW